MKDWAHSETLSLQKHFFSLVLTLLELPLHLSCGI